MRVAMDERFTAGTLLPEVPACGRDDQHTARPGLSPHVHRDAFEICLLTRGEVDWWVEDEVFVLRSGQVFFTRPGEWHGGVGSVFHPCELYWFQVRLPDAPVTGSGQSPLAGIAGDLQGLPVRHFVAGPQLRQAVCALIDEHRAPRAHAAVAARAALHLALAHLVREARATNTPPLSEPVRRALAWMAERVGEPFAVGDAAAAAGLSAVRLQARFQRELHCSVGEHRTRMRLHAAKRLLRDTEDSITDIAERLGFSSSQYFATTFRERVGLSPSAYRTAALPAAAPRA